MSRKQDELLIKGNLRKLIANWNGALTFYTCLPVPSRWPIAFEAAARWAPWAGAVIGALLAIADLSLSASGMPMLVRSTLIVALWIALTGGLHVDGVIDTADGLAVPDRDRRLLVMTDSRMGAFGGMAVVILLLLKVVALAHLFEEFEGAFSDRAFGLIAACIWGRWGQQWAIARYPYLKKEGKGAFHKAALPSIVHTLPSALTMMTLSIALALLEIIPTALALKTTAGGLGISWLSSAYFARQLGGHTGDTYGAVVEWTEAFLLCLLTTFY